MANLQREELLKGIENRECVARALDQAEQAIKTWEVLRLIFCRLQSWRTL